MHLLLITRYLKKVELLPSVRIVKQLGTLQYPIYARTFFGPPDNHACKNYKNHRSKLFDRYVDIFWIHFIRQTDRKFAPAMTEGHAVSTGATDFNDKRETTFKATGSG